MENQKEPRTYNRNFGEAVKNAFHGIGYTITSQKNSKVHLILAAVAVLIGIYLGLSKMEWIFVWVAILFVFFAELVNTAIETAVDLVTQNYHDKAKIAKDIGAGAVVIASINAIVIAYFVFFDKIVVILQEGIK